MARPEDGASELRVAAPSPLINNRWWLQILVGLAVALFFGYLAVQQIDEVDVRPPRGQAIVLLRNPAELDELAHTEVSLTATVSRSRGEAAVTYSVAACGPRPVRAILLLSGDARLEHVRQLQPNGAKPAAVRRVRGFLPGDPTDGPHELLDVHAPQQDCFTDAANPNEFIGAGVSFQGVAASEFEASDSAGGAFAFVGLGLPSPRSLGPYTGVAGEMHTELWTVPKTRVGVLARALGTDDRLDVTKPATQSTSRLSWQEEGYVRPYARWTNLSGARERQQFLIIFSIFAGVGASLIASGIVSTLSAVVHRDRR